MSAPSCSTVVLFIVIKLNPLFSAGENLPPGINPLFASELNGETFSYAFDVSNYPNRSKFDVKLWMAEIFFNSTRQRKFDVTIEDTLVLDDLDLIEDIGDKFVAKAYDFEVTVRDGTLDMVFTAVENLAKVSGVEILYDSGDQ